MRSIGLKKTKFLKLRVTPGVWGEVNSWVKNAGLTVSDLLGLWVRVILQLNPSFVKSLAAIHGDGTADHIASLIQQSVSKNIKQS